MSAKDYKCEACGEDLHFVSYYDKRRAVSLVHTLDFQRLPGPGGGILGYRDKAGLLCMRRGHKVPILHEVVCRGSRRQ